MWRLARFWCDVWRLKNGEAIVVQCKFSGIGIDIYFSKTMWEDSTYPNHTKVWSHRHLRCRIVRNTIQAKIAERLSAAWWQEQVWCRASERVGYDCKEGETDTTTDPLRGSCCEHIAITKLRVLASKNTCMVFRIIWHLRCLHLCFYLSPTPRDNANDCIIFSALWF